MTGDLYNVNQSGACGRNGATTVFIVLSSVTLAIATVLIPLRLYARLYITRSLWWDDITVLIAYLILIPYFSILWRMVEQGLGYRMKCVYRDGLTNVLGLEDVSEFLQIICAMFSRISVALFVGRLFAVTKSMKMWLYGYTIFMSISMIATAIVTFCMCYPEKALWNIQPGSMTNCTSTAGMNFRNYYNGAVGALSDFLLALLPVYFLSRLQLSKDLKIGLGLLLAVGLIPAGCCLTRTIVMSQVDNYELLDSFAKVVLFGGIEASVLVICACVPAMKPFFSERNQGIREQVFRSSGWKWRTSPKVTPRQSGTNTPVRNQICVTRDLSIRSASQYSGPTVVGIVSREHENYTSSPQSQETHRV